MRAPSLRSLQSHLVASFAIAVFVPAGIATLAGMWLISSEVLTRAETKTLSDLNSAREIYRNEVARIESVTRLTAARSLLADALKRDDRALLEEELGRTLAREGLDLLTALDARATVLARGRSPGRAGDVLADDPFVAAALATRQRVAGTGISSGRDLLAESPELADRAAMDVVSTPLSRPHAGRCETSGMMLKAAVPVLGQDGALLGVLLGGVLLNRSAAIVDKIKEVVHEGQVYEGRDVGTATIFQGDLRIATNVRNEDGSRAIATLVSDEVGSAVLREGRRWVGEAFVVNAWYIAAYEPIRDPGGRIVGILYVGILRQPFSDVRWRTSLVFGGIAAGSMLLVVSIAVLLSRRISRPLRTLEEAARRIAGGELGPDLVVKAPEEVEDLARSLNRMARTLAVEKRELEEWGATLERRVEERTEEIRRMHAQLLRSEKLASLGTLAAGVAHEINNPLTGILSSSSLLLEELAADDPHRPDVEVVVKESIRCREIVRRLLDFAKQRAPRMRRTDVNALVENVVVLVRSQPSMRNVALDQELDRGLPEVLCDADQIQQVFLNIVLNAAEAMTGGGRLSIRSRRSPDGASILVSFTDSGPGIPEERRGLIFDPFFTTKEHGTGLGLSISYGIVEQHGGCIGVESAAGAGSTFIVALPASRPEAEG